MFKKLMLSVIPVYLLAHVLKASVSSMADAHVLLIWSVLGSSIAAIYSLSVIIPKKGDIKFAVINSLIYFSLSVTALFTIPISGYALLMLFIINVISTLVLSVHPVEYRKFYPTDKVLDINQERGQEG